jgi:hypothetical protein
MIDLESEELKDLDDRDVIGIVASNRNFQQLSEFEMIMGDRGQAATINQAKEMFANRQRVYFVDMIGNNPGSSNNMYVLSKFNIQWMEPNNKIKNFNEFFQNSKFDLIKDQRVKEKIFSMDPSFTYKYYWQWLKRNNITLSEKLGIIRGICSKYIRKPNMKSFIRAVGCLIDLTLGIEEIFRRLSSINYETDICRKDNGKIYNYTSDFLKSLKIEAILENEFVDLPDIEFIKEEKLFMSPYVQLVVDLGRAMKIAVLYERKECLVNPLPDGFQDFSILDGSKTSIF